ncbi:ABC transporter permease [Mesorhizobium sp. YR577]|uniref:ABC transporter permease n=1 Tax=Mesorhizobium sp. YR577 TaxID=1884373 RepID=UPI0008E56CEE|nr:ABC transporter permease [Mesorhizobium sp. YR577]SFU15613.1 putative spermidine/putrescine transport system permease protein [Mesorhizobium sp. YR577]
MQESTFKRWSLHLILAATLLFMLAPILIVIVNSFNASAYNAWPPEGYTLDWYRKVLANPAFQRGAINSLIIGVISTALVLALGTPMAYALGRIHMRGITAFKSVLFAPLIVPRVAIGFALFVLFVGLGSATGLRLYGTYTGVILAHSVLMLPFVVAILTASFGEVDPIVEEAARDLGATPIGAFRLAVLPQIKGALLVAGIFSFITSFDEVETTLFIVKPAVNTLPVEMYNYLEQYQDPTLAALSTLLIAFTFIVVLIVPFAVKGSDLFRIMTSGRK